MLAVVVVVVVAAPQLAFEAFVLTSARQPQQPERQPLQMVPPSTQPLPMLECPANLWELL